MLTVWMQTPSSAAIDVAVNPVEARRTIRDRRTSACVDAINLSR
jgi:hypothetical protein